MSRPARPRRSAPAVTAVPAAPVAPAVRRRAVLRAAGALALLAPAGCGTVALGGPREYTPPPPGIDDLYRVDLLALLDRALAGAEQVRAGSGSEADPAAAAALVGLAAALPVQRTALLTGAQYERQVGADQDAPRTGTGPPAPSGAAEDLPALVAVLDELRDLGASAARQVSGSLARPVVAIAAHAAWSALRLGSAAGPGAVTASPSAEDLVPRREVPTTDPPSIGAQADYHASIEQAQRAEWYAGYLHEVLAARAERAVRRTHLALVDLHRGRAADLGAIAEEDGAPQVPRQAVYPLPDGTLEERTAAQLPEQIARGLLIDHITLVGAAPFARRPLPIAAALEEAGRLASLTDRLEPVPSLEVEDPPVAG